jgi:hypothetical protein
MKTSHELLALLLRFWCGVVVIAPLCVVGSPSEIIGWGDYVPAAPEGLSNVVALAAGGSHSLALTSDGRIVGWGYSGYGETNAPGGLADVVALAAGGPTITAKQMCPTA